MSAITPGELINEVKPWDISSWRNFIEKYIVPVKVLAETVARQFIRDASEVSKALANSATRVINIAEKLIERINEIWVIVRNWSAVLHMGDLFWAESILRKELGEIRVKFFIPDIYNKSLRALDDVVRGLKY